MFYCHMWLFLCQTGFILYTGRPHKMIIASKNHSVTQPLLLNEEQQTEYLALQIRMTGSHNLI